MPTRRSKRERVFCLVNAPRATRRPSHPARGAIMRASGVSAAGEMRFEDRTGPGVDAADDAGRLRPPLPVDARSALRQGDPRLEGVVRAGGIEDPASGSLSCRRQRPSGPGRADGGAVGPAGSDSGDAGPCFDQAVDPGGYAWWYVDAVSDDRRHGVAIIAFVGSVFSPYYAWAGRRDPWIIARSTSRSTGREARFGR